MWSSVSQVELSRGTRRLASVYDVSTDTLLALLIRCLPSDRLRRLRLGADSLGSVGVQGRTQGSAKLSLPIVSPTLSLAPSPFNSSVLLTARSPFVALTIEQYIARCSRSCSEGMAELA
jgi:hypothetical protein